MVSLGVVRTIVGIVGNVISCGLFLSPIPTFVKIIKKKDVESFDSKPYLATVLNCMCWVYYGMPFVNPNSTLVYTINGFGLVIELIYLGIFSYYAAPKGRKRVLIYLICEVAFFAGLVIPTMLAIPEHKMVINRPMRAVVVGVICDVFNVIMYSSPLFIVRDVIRTKSVKYMPLPLSFTNFLNGCCWTGYALIGKTDYFILISNSLGSLAGFVQLAVYAWISLFYKKTTPKDEDLPAKPTNEVQLSDVV